MSISGPKLGPDQPDRIIDCEFALDPAFQAMAEEAIVAVEMATPEKTNGEAR